MNARFNSNTFLSASRCSAYLLFHPTHLRFLSLCYFHTQLGLMLLHLHAATKLDPGSPRLVEALTGEIVFSSSLRCTSWRLWQESFQKWGPGTTHRSLSGFQVNTGSSSQLFLSPDDHFHPSCSSEASKMISGYNLTLKYSTQESRIKTRRFCCAEHKTDKCEKVWSSSVKLLLEGA